VQRQERLERQKERDREWESATEKEISYLTLFSISIVPVAKKSFFGLLTQKPRPKSEPIIITRARREKEREEWLAEALTELER
jgi:hypothetical protein